MLVLSEFLLLKGSGRGVYSSGRVTGGIVSVKANRI